MRVTLLGTGTSHGIPMIGCDCPICTSDDPRDRRTRTSALVGLGEHNILIDTSPELRLQCLACDVRRVDAVLFTHAHADHVTGLDDLRRFNWLNRAVLPIYADRETLDCLDRMYAYAFAEDPDYPSAKPELAPIEITGPWELFGREILPLRLYHGELPIFGYRIDGFAYCTDCSFIPAETLARLTGLDVLVLDALRRRPHPTHFNLEQAVEMARRIGARRTYFTHIAHELKHEEVNRGLPAGMALGFDGQAIDV